ncbi:MAG: glycolate oxidase subunit GlcE [Burkholderiaceae bacterium]|nr:glycolate oxidase subunit GlcE [Burkholderiaceae bacterium]
MLDSFRDQIRQAAADKTPLRIRGGGTKDWYGGAPVGALLDTSGHAGVVDYEPSELVITARCGTPLAQIEALLARHGQMLAFEPPRFGTASTIGGVVAAGLSGPRRMAAGSVRDFVLGAQLMNGAGEVLNFGGQVMKNVAGYDVSRLLAGSMGTLGLITQVSLKVLPVPVREATLQMPLDEITALRRLNEWAGQPLPLSASCWHDGVLSVRLSGAASAVAAALDQLGGASQASVMPDAQAQALWAALRDHTHPYFDTPQLWRMALPPHASVIILKGASLIEWGGGQRWLHADAAGANPAARAAEIRRTVAACGGHATLFRSPDKSVPAFHPPSPALALLNRRMQQAFDPDRLFNRGRLQAGEGAADAN